MKMKIEQAKEDNFKPITITLETREEAEMLISLCGRVSGKGRLFNFLSEIYRSLYFKKIEMTFISNFKTNLEVE